LRLNRNQGALEKIKMWVPKKFASEEDLLAALEQAVSAGDWGEVCRLTWTAQPLRSRKFTSIMCEILDNHKNGHTFEAAVDALMSIRDPSSVPALVRAVDYHLDGDDGFHINQKILNILFAIRTNEAIAGLRLATRSSEEIISDAARMYLEGLESNR
jgi:hypothetical protein